MRALICGSMAYDTIMVFEDQFKNHILEDQIHILNVCFFAPKMRREYGGCAGNIAYNLRLLGGEPLIMATVGKDFGPYQDWLNDKNISNLHIKTVDSEFTAQAFITTDIDNNQITAFHPGAMNNAHENSVADTNEISIGIVAPDGKQAMHQHAADFVSAGIPFVFDPGQGLPMFSGEELKIFIEQASYAIVNDYESKMMQEKTGLSETEIASKLEAYIVTKGSEGSIIYLADDTMLIPAANISKAIDPTGCGDAFRGGLLFGLLNGCDWHTAGRIASLAGAIKIEHAGTQNHSYSFAEFVSRYEKTFEEALNI